MARSWWTLGAAALSLASCATSGSFDADVGSRVQYTVRAVGSETPERIAVEAAPVPAAAPAPLEPWIAEHAALRSFWIGVEDDAFAAASTGAAVPDPALESFDPSLLPAPRLGVEFELGVACEEPDEELHNSDVHSVSGIAETLLRVTCSYDLTHSAELVGTAAASQILDETFEATIADSELIWLAVGVRFSF